jgi:hypothetical protein
MYNELSKSDPSAKPLWNWEVFLTASQQGLDIFVQTYMKKKRDK